MSSPDRKYLRVIAKGVLLHIRRHDTEVYRVFSARRYGSLERAWVHAINERDRLHLELFGSPVTEGFAHVHKRSGSDPSLPAGISREYARDGSLRYFVASCQREGKTKRMRFNARTHTPGGALFRALLARSTHLGIPWQSLLDLLDPGLLAQILAYLAPSPEASTWGASSHASPE